MRDGVATAAEFEKRRSASSPPTPRPVTGRFSQSNDAVGSVRWARIAGNIPRRRALPDRATLRRLRGFALWTAWPCSCGCFAVSGRLCRRRRGHASRGSSAGVLLPELTFEGANALLHLPQPQERRVCRRGRTRLVGLLTSVLSLSETDASRRCGQHREDAPSPGTSRCQVGSHRAVRARSDVGIKNAAATVACDAAPKEPPGPGRMSPGKSAQYFEVNDKIQSRISKTKDVENYNRAIIKELLQFD
jgi:hypothetical protein